MKFLDVKTDFAFKKVFGSEGSKDILNAGSLAYIPETLSVLPGLSHAFTIANEAGLTPEEHEAQWKRKDFIMLQKGSIELAEK